MHPHNQACIKCGTTLAKVEIKRNKNNEPIPRQVCFNCKTSGRR